MPGVQCVICLSSDTSSEEWCVLKDCGHVFHTHCLMQSLEHSKKCPQCRVDYKGGKYNTRNPPYQRIFFEFSDEPASQPPPDRGGGAGAAAACGGTGGGGSVDLQQIAFLQGQLRDKDRRIQQICGQLAEQEGRQQRLEQELEMARSGIRDKDVRLQEKVLELSREHKQVKQLANQVANMAAQLKAESARASLLSLATDHSLSGGGLAGEVDKLVRLGLKAPNDFWERLMSERSQVIIANSNRHGREKAALERQQQQLQAEMDKLQEQVATLKRSLAAARQQQPAGAAAAAHDLLSQQQQQQQLPHGSGAALAGRHAVRRFGTASGGVLAGAAAATGEDDPLVHSYDILNMRLGDLPRTQRRPSHQQQQQPPVQQQQQQQQPHGASAGGSGRPAGRAGVMAPPPAPVAPVQQDESDEDDVVVLDGSDDQEQQLEGAEDERCYSEIESDAEDFQQQQQQEAAAQAGAAWQQQQQAGSGSVLGKRPAFEPAAPRQQVRPAAAPGASCASGSQAALADENCASGSGISRGGAPQLAAAGPGRGGLQHAPGRTFIKDVAAAGVGIDRGKYFSSGPDGRGGVATAYQGGSSAPVRMSQKQLDVRAMQQAGGSKKARGSSHSSSLDVGAAKALRQNNLPISMYFSRQQQ